MSIIKNISTLATTKSKRHVLEVIDAGISSVLPENLLKHAVRFDKESRVLAVNKDDFDLSSGRIFIVGGGKASGRMAQVLEGIIGAGNITGGVVNCKESILKTEKIRVICAGHPLPDERGIEGVKEMLELKKQYDISENDVVVALISGGGSALMPCPTVGISLKDKQAVTDLLIKSGAEIGEINTIRKHLSQVKGGKLGKYFNPARVISLIISDVIGNSLEVIASGPTVPDESTFRDAYRIIERYELSDKVPESVTRLLVKGCRGEVEETCKTLNNCHNYIIGDNRLSLDTMRAEALAKGYTVDIVTAQQKGDVDEAARSRALEITTGKYKGYDVLLIGGETTVKVPSKAGKGGRNQHYAAASMIHMTGYPEDWVIASASTDGSDFLPDVAGAIVDSDTLETARRKNIDVKSYLDRYDSYTLMEQIGDSLIVTGDTGTNVGDIVVYLKNREV